MLSGRHLPERSARPRAPFSWPRFGVLATLAGVLLVVVAVPAPSHAQGTLPAGFTTTPYGPLGPADRDLLVRVRLAGLWEGPVGQQAQEHAESARVKEVGAHLATDHHGLDVQVRSVAARLGVALPDLPSNEQQGWMNELAGKWGADFDVTFANRLRAAHGKVFSVVAAVRAGTRNDMVRSFAETAVNVVMKHMTLLESTGLVDFGALPVPVPPAQRAAPFGRGAGAPVAWTVLVAAIIAATAAAARAVRPR
jgi:predicted outer membrane protein